MLIKIFQKLNINNLVALKRAVGIKLIFYLKKEIIKIYSAASSAAAFFGTRDEGIFGSTPP